MVTVRDKFNTLQETSEDILRIANMKTLLPPIYVQPLSACQPNQEAMGVNSY